MFGDEDLDLQARSVWRRAGERQTVLVNTALVVTILITLLITDSWWKGKEGGTLSDHFNSTSL